MCGIVSSNALATQVLCVDTGHIVSQRIALAASSLAAPGISAPVTVISTKFKGDVAHHITTGKLSFL